MHPIPGMVPNFTKGSLTLSIKGTGIVQGMIMLFCLSGTVFRKRRPARCLYLTSGLQDVLIGVTFFHFKTSLICYLFLCQHLTVS